MAKAYSYDLRQKLINAIKLDGMKRSEAAELAFGLLAALSAADIPPKIQTGRALQPKPERD